MNNDLSNSVIFPKGEKLPEMFSKNFIGQAWLQILAVCYNIVHAILDFQEH